MMGYAKRNKKPAKDDKTPATRSSPRGKVAMKGPIATKQPRSQVTKKLKLNRDEHDDVPVDDEQAGPSNEPEQESDVSGDDNGDDETRVASSSSDSESPEPPPPRRPRSPPRRVHLQR